MEKLYCKRCNKTKPSDQFNKNKSMRTGHQHYCRSCTLKYYKMYGKMYKFKYEQEKSDEAYYQKYPEKWIPYQKEYMDEYLKNPINSKRQTLSCKVARLFKLDRITPADVCACGTIPEEGKRLKAFFPLAFIKKYLKRRVSEEVLIENVVWKCNGCVTKERKKAKHK